MPAKSMLTSSVDLAVVRSLLPSTVPADLGNMLNPNQAFSTVVLPLEGSINNTVAE